jgi:hypothetical protein
MQTLEFGVVVGGLWNTTRLSQVLRGRTLEEERLVSELPRHLWRPRRGILELQHGAFVARPPCSRPRTGDRLSIPVRAPAFEPMAGKVTQRMTRMLSDE